MSRTQSGIVELILKRRLPAPVDILVAIHLSVSRGSVQVGHSITKVYVFVTQTSRDRLDQLSRPGWRSALSGTRERYWSIRQRLARRMNLIRT
ncbi:unnamed protein product [Protopolystoma xenopodis]|uniref:Fibulin C-terminal Ig-like domain-containing protein n=1 Tax=Protopolystoma xenopodis TaxID=117903 RepID=A0A3S5AMA1_9PLAT|nr:unnamed protein product [Protopolystoma xenopodis]